METEDLTIEGLIHDLNNVFQTVADGAEVLSTDPRWQRLAGTLERSVERGRRIVASIMETSRSPAELGPVVSGAIQFAQDFIENTHHRPVTFCSEVQEGFPVPGSSAAWERVLVNLLLNAAQAGAEHITVVAADGKITIRDDGRGIPDALLPRIFEPRVSTRSSTSGLGLSIVRSIVEKNGGRVSARNAPGRGAEFVIELSA
jgi:signal transduction histidine kinase